jgi:hypothetical protein
MAGMCPRMQARLSMPRAFAHSRSVPFLALFPLVAFKRGSN